jgi:putative peptidoglycan lipid II flippase
VSERTRRLAWAAVVVAVATALSRIVGLGREVLTAGYYGVDPDLNVFISVSVVPNLIRQLFADAAISAAFVPVFTALLVAGDVARARRLAGSLLGLVLLAVGAVTAALLLTASPLAHALYPELTATPEALTLAAELLQILTPTVLVLSVAGVLIGILYSFERFTMPAVVSILWNLAIIAFIVLASDRLGVYALAWGNLVGTLVEVALLAWALRDEGGFLRPRLALGDPLLRRVLLLMVPITLTLGILNFNALIGTLFAQYVSASAAAEIAYAFRLYQLPQGIFAVTIGTVLFPSLSRFAALDDLGRFRETLSLGAREMVYVSLPFVVWFAVIPGPIVALVYERGAFDAAATEGVSIALAFYSLGLVFANVNIMFNRGFQSLQRPWLPFYVGLINLGLNALLIWLLLDALGVGAITLSTSAVSAFNFFALLWLMRRQVERVDGRRMARSAAGAVVCALALGMVSWSAWRLLDGFAAAGFAQRLVALAVAMALGAAVYVGLSRALRLPELGLVWQAVRRRGGAGPGGPAAGGSDDTPDGGPEGPAATSLTGPATGATPGPGVPGPRG